MLMVIAWTQSPPHRHALIYSLASNAFHATTSPENHLKEDYSHIEKIKEKGRVYNVERIKRLASSDNRDAYTL